MVESDDEQWYPPTARPAGISYKRGRDYGHSPDRFYQEKLSLVELARFRAYYDPDHSILLYLDELTYYRQPSLSQAYELQRHRTSVACLAQFWFDLRAAYPHANRIYVVVDNWPVHFHPDVLAPLQAQAFPFAPKLPSNCPPHPAKKHVTITCLFNCCACPPMLPG